MAETVTLKPENPLVSRLPREDFPNPRSWFPTNLRQDPDQTCARTIVKKTPDSSTFYYSECNPEILGGWAPSYRLGPRKSALGNLPDDESQFPVSSWFKQLLSQGVQRFVLDSQRMRLASPPRQTRGFKTDGSNLPWVVERLRSSGSSTNGSGHQTSEAFQDWLSHVRTALPDIEDIRTIEREDDRHRYLMLCYSGGLQVPSWMASDGTLRLLALTLPPYLPDFEGIYLIEEPENGIHPSAVEAVFQSLSSAYRAQILLATHSPIVLGLVDPKQLLCFAKDDQGATDIVRGDEHPALADWKQGVELSTLFASGVLG